MMKWLAPAKVNLSLRVLGRRPDGYHELETLMAPLALADELTVEPLYPQARGEVRSSELICSDPTLPTDFGNLAWRAAELFRVRVPATVTPVRLRLQKNIPHGAGLGGGSSNAAAVLLALNELHRNSLTLPELAKLAAELGSDVPFFVFRSAAYCRGRGEQVEPVAFPNAIPLLLLKPAFPVPTPWAYKRWADSRELPGISYGTQRFAWGEMYNDLERPVFEKYLLLAEIKMWLLAQEEVAGALLSGSGSTMIAVLRRVGEAASVADRAIRQFGDLWTCECATLPG